MSHILFPRRCISCGNYLLHRTEAVYPLCRECEAMLRATLITGPRCAVCGRPLLGEQGVCTACRGRSYRFHSVLPLGLYEGVWAAVLRAYKLEQHRLLAELLAALLSPAVEELAEGRLLVQVPSRAASVRRRGWDHTAEISRHLARRCGYRFLPLLQRRRSRAQKSLDYAARSRNMEGSITLRRGVSVEDAGVLLFDDILTTGATLDACAGVLRQAGAREVRAVVIAADP